MSALFASSSARAECAAIFESEACDGGLGTDICESDGDGGIICDLAANGTATQGGTAWFTSDAADSFSAFGIGGKGEEFCCEFAIDSSDCAGTFDGTPYGDQMQFFDQMTGDSLLCSDMVAHAGAGNDWITGSDYYLYGDEIYGEGDNDSIHLKGGSDYCSGGDGNDEIWGEDHYDTIDGDAGMDKIKGGDYADTLHGGDDADQVCGDDGVDSVYGDGGNNDIAFGGGGVDAINSGGDGSGDNCEDDADDGSCEDDSQTSCPW